MHIDDIIDGQLLHYDVKKCIFEIGALVTLYFPLGRRNPAKLNSTAPPLSSSKEGGRHIRDHSGTSLLRQLQHGNERLIIDRSECLEWQQ